MSDYCHPFLLVLFVLFTLVSYLSLEYHSHQQMFIKAEADSRNRFAFNLNHKKKIISHLSWSVYDSCVFWSHGMSFYPKFIQIIQWTFEYLNLVVNFLHRRTFSQEYLSKNRTFVQEVIDLVFLFFLHFNWSMKHYNMYMERNDRTLIWEL